MYAIDAASYGYGVPIVPRVYCLAKGDAKMATP